MTITPGQRIFSGHDLASADDAPLYLRIKRIVSDAASSGELRQGDALPSERDLADLLKVSRVTVRKAFVELVNEGVLNQRRGSGTFVGAPVIKVEQALSRLTSFTEDMRLRGITTHTELLSRQTSMPTPEETLKLSLSPTDFVSRWRRLRYANDTPLAIEHAVIPVRFLPEPSEFESSLYATLATRGFKPVRALQRLHAVALGSEEAKLLKTALASPALFIERISYLADGRIVEFTSSHYRGDSYDFVAELALANEGAA